LRQTAIEFEVDGQQVDGVMCGPAVQTGRAPGVVVCHPHPLFGGSMDSSVVLAVCYELAHLGVASLRFNFRRPADGSPAVGDGAVRDVANALSVIRRWDQVNPRRCGVAGYSFGAAAILRAWGELKDARAVALIAPPLNALRSSPIGEDKRPRQVVVGERDRLVNADQLSEAIESMRRRPALTRIEGADHLLAGHESKVGRTVADFLARSLA
jgi:alpha/beta superfamily hydrolase